MAEIHISDAPMAAAEGETLHSSCSAVCSASKPYSAESTSSAKSPCLCLIQHRPASFVQETLTSMDLDGGGPEIGV